MNCSCFGLQAVRVFHAAGVTCGEGGGWANTLSAASYLEGLAQSADALVQSGTVDTHSKRRRVNSALTRRRQGGDMEAPRRPVRITYGAHALASLADRGLDRAWIEHTVIEPDSTEPDPKHPDRGRAYRPVPERDGRVLREVYVPVDGGAHIVPAFLDRGRRRAL